jgi:PKD repeat protein
VSNTSGTPLIGARVSVIDGPNAGSFVLTNVNGSYRFETLSMTNMNFSATASDYFEQRAGTFVNGTNSLNFVLAPVPPPPPPPPPATISITTRLISGGTGSAAQEWGFTAVSSVVFDSYDWDFGDGSGAVGSHADEQHVYRSKGTFKVTVTGRRRGADPVVATLDLTVS